MELERVHVSHVSQYQSETPYETWACQEWKESYFAGIYKTRWPFIEHILVVTDPQHFHLFKKHIPKPFCYSHSGFRSYGQEQLQKLQTDPKCPPILIITNRAQWVTPTCHYFLFNQKSVSPPVYHWILSDTAIAKRIAPHHFGNIPNAWQQIMEGAQKQSYLLLYTTTQQTLFYVPKNSQIPHHTKLWQFMKNKLEIQ